MRGTAYCIQRPHIVASALVASPPASLTRTSASARSARVSAASVSVPSLSAEDEVGAIDRCGAATTVTSSPSTRIACPATAATRDQEPSQHAPLRTRLGPRMTLSTIPGTEHCPRIEAVMADAGSTTVDLPPPELLPPSGLPLFSEGRRPVTTDGLLIGGQHIAPKSPHGVCAFQLSLVVERVSSLFSFGKLSVQVDDQVVTNLPHFLTTASKPRSCKKRRGSWQNSLPSGSSCRACFTRYMRK